MVEVADTARDLKPGAAPTPCVGGTFEPPSSSKQAFGRYCEEEFMRSIRGWRMRAPAKSRDGLIAGVGIGSNCLAPMLRGNERMYFDPTLPAEDGDLVLVRVRSEWLQRIADEADDAWRKTYAPDGWTPNLWVKLLRHGAGRRWLLARDVAVPLDVAGEIVGVCRRIERPMRFALRFAAILGAVCVLWALIYVVAAILVRASG